MTEKIQVGVIGLGKFGFQFGRTLANKKVQVIGVDHRPGNITRAKMVFTHVFEADASNKQALLQLGFADLTHVLVSVGDSIAASSMISMFLKEMNGPKVWVKAINEDHEKLLRKIGADEVFIPENLAAKQLANRLVIPGFIEQLPFADNMAIREIVVNNWANKKLSEIDLTNRYRVQVIAIKKSMAETYTFVPKANDFLEANDILVVIGDIEELGRLKP